MGEPASERAPRYRERLQIVTRAVHDEVEISADDRWGSRWVLWHRPPASASDRLALRFEAREQHHH